MTTTQTQLRRDTATNIAASTPAAGEPFYDTTNKRLGVGDGVAAGGIPHVSAPDLQKGNFVYSAVGGTANAITLTNSPPVGSYGNGVGLQFKATGTNTGAVTVNVDGLGTKNVYKLYNGTLQALSAGDIVSGAIYDITYDGTQFQIKGLPNSVPETYPAAVTGTLSGASTVFTVDFTTYSAYDVLIGGAVGSNLVIDVSTNGGGSWVVVNSGLYHGVADRLAAKIFQPSAGGNAHISGLCNANALNDGWSVSAAINKIRVRSQATFSSGDVILQPTTKR